MPMTILAANSVSGFFEEVVDDALKSRKVEAPEGVRTYIVGLLVDYAHPDQRAGETLARPLAFLLDEAMKTPDRAERFERLRALGDGVLYACGFFGDHFESRGLDQRYLFSIGTTAYGSLGSMLRAPAKEDDPCDVFGELAKKFGVFVDVLVDVSDSTLAMGSTTPKTLLKTYERWLKTGSDRLANALSSHGLVPVRGPKGLQ
jgi:hypothetical protein